MIIATEFYDGQGLGNQLWVYAACRAIARRLCVQHKILGAERFKGAAFLDIDAGSVEVEGWEPQASFHERLYYDAELEYMSSGFDERILDIEQDTKIEGLFQDERYFFGDLGQIGGCLKLKPEYAQRFPVGDDDCCVLNIRGGEYKRHKRLLLPRQYWEDAMQNMQTLYGVRKFVAVSDDDRYVRALFPGIPVLRGGIGDDYMALYQAKYVILSNSSFAYFPVRTGIPKKCVIAPSQWARYGDSTGRWASVANLYDGWLWQGRDGRLRSCEDCRPQRDQTERYYHQNFFVHTSTKAVQKVGVRRYIPYRLRRSCKWLLSIFFPKHIG